MPRILAAALCCLLTACASNPSGDMGTAMARVAVGLILHRAQPAE